MGNRLTFIMTNSELFPYTAAWHIFHTGFPVKCRPIDIMSEKAATNLPFTIPLSFGRYDKEDHIRELMHATITISQMVEIFFDGVDFFIENPKVHAGQIKWLLEKHIRDWNSDYSFEALDIDEEGLKAMHSFLRLVDQMSREATGTSGRIASSEFAKALLGASEFENMLGGKGTLDDVFGGNTTGFHNPFSPQRALSSAEERNIDEISKGRNVYLDALLDD